MAAALVAAGLGVLAWVLSTDLGDVVVVELKSRKLERRLRSDRLDHDAIRAECEGLFRAVGTNTLLVLKDHQTPLDPRVPGAIRALEPDVIRASTNQVALAWYRQLGVCGLIYYGPDVDLDEETAAMTESFGDTDANEQTVIPVAEQVLFYSFRMNLLQP
jgi:hypothetical protein